MIVMLIRRVRARPRTPPSPALGLPWTAPPRKILEIGINFFLRTPPYSPSASESLQNPPRPRPPPPCGPRPPPTLSAPSTPSRPPTTFGSVECATLPRASVPPPQPPRTASLGAHAALQCRQQHHQCHTSTSSASPSSSSPILSLALTLMSEHQQRQMLLPQARRRRAFPPPNEAVDAERRLQLAQAEVDSPLPTPSFSLARCPPRLARGQPELQQVRER